MGLTVVDAVVVESKNVPVDSKQYSKFVNLVGVRAKSALDLSEWRALVCFWLSSHRGRKKHRHTSRRFFPHRLSRSRSSGLGLLQRVNIEGPRKRVVVML